MMKNPNTAIAPINTDFTGHRECILTGITITSAAATEESYSVYWQPHDLSDIMRMRYILA
jgi:hypothetical protein